MWLMAFGAIGVQVKGKPLEAGGFEKTRLGSLAVCGSHLCPVCAPRVASQRTDEVKAVLAKAKAQGLVPVMLTLTVKHQRGDALPALLGGLKSALRRWKQHRAYKAARPRLHGVIAATEATHGRNGWHPHHHLILLVEGTRWQALRLVATLRKPWEAALKGEGLECGRAGFKATAADDAARYMAKWDVAPEVANSPAKKGRDKSSRTPAQLLRDGYQGDKRAAALWAEWAAAMKGKSVLRFSPGLKAWAGLLDISDEEAAQAPDDEAVLIDLIDGGEWEAAKAGGLCRDGLLLVARQGRRAVRRYLADCLESHAPLIEDG